jgi:DNA-binding response OmpR family regulator
MWKILCASIDGGVRSEAEKLGRGTSYFKVKCVPDLDEMFVAAISETFDAYVLDTSLRRDSPLDLVRAIRNADPVSKILCLSLNESNRYKAIAAGADVFIKLPDEMHLLRLRVEDLFDKVGTELG